MAEDKLLRYSQLSEFDHALLRFAKQSRVLHCAPAFVVLKHESDKIIAFLRHDAEDVHHYIFVASFHPSRSFTDYRIAVHVPGAYECVLHTDTAAFGGHNRADPSIKHYTQQSEQAQGSVKRNEKHYLSLYIPNRTFQILKLIN